MTIDERIAALTMNVELLSHDVSELRISVKDLVEHDKVQDRRFARFESIVLRLGASHSERIRDLEKRDSGDETDPEK
jgi:hypothetical protein